MTDAEFVDAFLPRARFDGCALERADFSDANVSGTAFDEAVLPEASFDGVHGVETRFRDAVLRNGTFEEASLSDSTFSGADLDHAVLHRADLFGADLRNASLYGAITSDALIDADTSLPVGVEGELERATWTYGTIERLARRNSLPDVARKAYVRRKDRRKRRRRDEGAVLGWAYLAAMDFLMRYGDSWLRVVRSSALVVLLFGVLYASVGGIRRSFAGGDAVSDVPLPVPDPLATLLVDVYFSAVTFTTLGYGDLHPATGLTRTLASLESYVGALLIALLVYVFGRRAEW